MSERYFVSNVSFDENGNIVSITFENERLSGADLAAFIQEYMRHTYKPSAEDIHIEANDGNENVQGLPENKA